MALCDDLDDIEKLVEKARNRAVDIETLTRVSAQLAHMAADRPARNQTMLERICQKLDIDISDLPPVRPSST